MTKTSARSRKFKAILAGGIVLGVGAAVTLAAWTDSEWAEGTFGAGSFSVEGSTDGTTFAEHESSDKAAELAFDMNADNLTPGDTTASPFVLRLKAGTTYDASVVLESASASGDNASALSYEIVQVDDVAACDASATGTTIVGADTPLNSTSGAQGFDLTAGDDAAGDPVTLCFKVTADDNLVQGQKNSAQWQFTATSAE